MTPESVIDIFAVAVKLIMAMVLVIILPSLVVGLVVSVFQAATQINEQTLSFLPRLLATLAALGVFGPWMLSTLIDYMTRLYADIPFLIG